MLTLEDSTLEREWRGTIRAWAADCLPRHLRWTRDFKELCEIDGLLSASRLLGLAWPTEFGGRALPPLLEAVVTEELASVGVRRAQSPSHAGVNMLGPTIIAMGSEEQKARFLPPIIRAEELWCQGFSEPDAGSDLANIRTRAVRDGETFIVNGSKIWTSHAETSHWMFALVRTEPREDSKHAGLSFVLFPMDAPGITVRVVRQVATSDSEFCEVFFDDVVIDAANVIGEEGKGWAVAMTLLASERMSGRFRYAQFWEETKRLGIEMREVEGGARREHWLAELGRSAAEIAGIEALSLRVDSMREAGVDTGFLASINKLWWPAAHQKLVELGLRASGETGADPADWYTKWLAARPESIYGGSAQVQRNILSERFLGLPRGPK
jgi:alkylation response protein AidB-like acyl-CoA dehydrogenase